ncbi:MAG TPA: GTPase RsgA, partial [Acidimicrobiales bacterium]|nr:GTPase RsgA [Acidimicrobiales bacterium]
MTLPDLVPYGWTDRWAALFAAATDDPPRPRAEPGRVLRHDGAGLLVALPGGPRALPLARPVDPPPTVGDWLVVDDGVPIAVLDRTSLLSRRAAGGDTQQLLAANVDLVLIVCGLDRPVKAGRIDRVVTLAWDAGAVPAVVLAKADLVAGVDERVAATAAAHPGVDVLATSVAT